VLYGNEFAGDIYGYRYAIKTVFLMVGARLIDDHPAMLDVIAESIQFGGRVINKIFDRFCFDIMPET
jgi:hypothetical protein